jgi:bifunctional DNA-binding transcriptional regulator/antitoxin component of YhaV-PrlF toxin-antitoxin module
MLRTMRAMTITSKRQATLPVALCQELGLRPGEKVNLDRRVVNGETVWVLRGRRLDWSWFGAARRYGKGKRHRWTGVRQSIERGWAEHDRS